MVVGVDGSVYVTNFNGSSNGQVLEYAGGSAAPTTTISFQTYPSGLALDRRNRLFVVYNDSSNVDIEALRFPPSKTRGKNWGFIRSTALPVTYDELDLLNLQGPKEPVFAL